MDVRFRKTGKTGKSERLLSFYQRYKENKENKETNNKKSSWILSLLVFIGVCSGFMFSLQAAEIVDFSSYPTLSMFYGLFPSMTPLGVEIKSYVAPEAAGLILLTASIAVYITNTVLFLLIPYYAIYTLISFKADDEPEPMIFGRLIVLVLLASVFNLFTVNIKHENGYESELSVLQFVMLETIGKFIHSAEDLAMIDLDEYYLVPSTTTLAPLTFKEDFSLVSKDYIRTSFDSPSDIGSIDVYKSDSVYTANYSLGGKIYTVSLPVNKSLNEKSESLNMSKLEEEFVIDYFQSLVDHAIKVESVVSQANVVKRLQGNSEFNYSTDKNSFGMFEGYYYNYCDDIYSITPPPNTSAEWRASYIEVAAMCASRNFINKHYQNPHYNYLSLYEGEPELEKGSTVLFGNNSSSLEMKFNEIESQTMAQCSQGYLACVESAEFYLKIKSEQTVKYGMLHGVFMLLNDIFFEVFEESMVVPGGKQIEAELGNQTGIKTVWKPEGTMIRSIPFPSHDTVYKGVNEVTIYLNSNGYTYTPTLDYSLDIGDYLSASALMESLDLKELSKLMLGVDPMRPFKRAAACLERPQEIYNGFRCGRISEEILKAGIGSFNTGMEIWTYSMLENTFGTRMQGESGTMTTGKNSITKSRATGAFGAAALVGAAEYGDEVSSALVGLVSEDLAKSMNDYFNTVSIKENPYYAGNTFYLVVITQAASKSLNSSAASNFWDGVGKMLLFVGFALVYLVSKFIYVLVKMIFAKLFEIIVETMMISMLLVMNVNEHGFAGIQHKYREFVADVGVFCVYIVIAASFAYFLDTILMIFAKEILFHFKATTASISSFIEGIFGFIVHLSVVIFVVMKLQDMLEQHLSSVVDDLLKKQNVNTEQAIK